MLRVALFAATNVAVLIVLSIFSRIFGLEQSLGAGNLNALLIMSAIIGMTGSVISLLMSKTMAKRSVGARGIETPGTPTESWIVQTVERHAREAGIKTPEVAIFDSPQHSYTQKLLSAVPIADPTADRAERKLMVDEIPSAVRPLDYKPEPLTFREVAPGHLVANE